MSIWRKQAINHKSTISWLLVTAILFIALMPAHFHSHHQTNNNLVAHDHFIDLHLINSETVQSHDEKNAVTFSLASLDKQNHPIFSPLALFSIFFVLLPLIKSRNQVRLDISRFALKHLFYFLSPPLRAPPQH